MDGSTIPLEPKTIIRSYKPAMTMNCADKYGSGNTFVNKLQSKSCMHCKQIHDAALLREKQTGVEQHYDIFVAYSLCSYQDLEGPQGSVPSVPPNTPNDPDP